MIDPDKRDDSDRRYRQLVGRAAVGCLFALYLGCGPQDSASSSIEKPRSPVRSLPTLELDPPSLPEALGANWVAGAQVPTLSWLEELDAGSHRLRMARLEPEGWGEPSTIVFGGGFFANWADFPVLAQSGGGEIFASWLEKNGPGTYAYSVQTAASVDGGTTWGRLGRLHEDASETEHGFVGLVPADDGVHAFWLDGRAMVEEGPMALRSTYLYESQGAGEPRRSPEEQVDRQVCECCQISAAATANGPVVAFRNRSSEEIRDIYVARKGPQGWQEPVRVHRDDWRIPGCPVNGPALAAQGQQLAVAWFTGADPGPRVQLVFSDDAGQSFGPAIEVDATRPLGRVDLALTPEGNALVSWITLSADDAQAEIRLQRFTPGGDSFPPATIALVNASRATGFPRMLLHESMVYVVFREVPLVTAPAHLRLQKIPLSSL